MSAEALTIRVEVVAKLEDLRKEFKYFDSPIERTARILDFFDAIESYLAIKDPLRPARPKLNPDTTMTPSSHEDRIIEKGYKFADLDEKHSYFIGYLNNEIDYLRDELLRFKPA